MLTINASVLLEAIKTVSPAVPSRPTHPILGNIIVETKGNQVTLKAFDLSTGIIVTIPNIEVTVETVIALPAKLFESIVGSLEGDVTFVFVDIDPDSQNKQIGLKDKDSYSKISFLSADEFPELPEVTENSIEFDTEIFKALASATLYSCSTDETKQVLTGVHIDSQPQKIEFASTDGHRLTKASHTWEEPNTSEPVALTIPAKSISSILKVVDSTKSFTLFFDDNQIGIKTDNKTITTRKLEGAYPAYNQLVPAHFEKKAIFNTKAFTKALNFASLATDDKNQLIVLSFRKGKDICTIYAQNQSVVSNQSNCPTEVTGIDDIFEIALNYKYASEAIKNLKCGEFTLNMNLDIQPVTMTPLGGANITALVMPVKIVR
jgi:DNA polymerase-3 subunit beta